MHGLAEGQNKIKNKIPEFLFIRISYTEIEGETSTLKQKKKKFEWKRKNKDFKLKKKVVRE